MEGRLLDGRYLPLEERGRGSVATVWRAFDSLREREVALKLPRREAGRSAWREILVEAAALSRLDHPHIVRLLDMERSCGGVLPAGAPYLVLEHLRGGPANASPPARTRAGLRILARQGLGALDHLHRAGLVHRDLKPANLVVGGAARSPRLTLVDLGSSSPGRRGSGRYAGSAAWGAPEVLRGGAADERADLYALGRVLHGLAGGEPPFELDDPFGLSRWLLEPRPLGPIPGLPSDLARLVAALTDPAASRRPATAREALALLGDSTGGTGVTPLRMPRRLAAAVREGLRLARADGRALVRRTVGPGRRHLLLRIAALSLRAAALPLGPPPARVPPEALVGRRAARLFPPGEAAPGLAEGLTRLRTDSCVPIVLLLDAGERGDARLEGLARRLTTGGAGPGGLLVVLLGGDGAPPL